MNGVLKEKFQKILISVVDQHIRISRPISSFYIMSLKTTNLSSSSIRAVFFKLEEQGYLCSLHPSSGRIPTVKAYRYYVSHLPRIIPPKPKDCHYAQTQFLKCGSNYSGILKTTAKILSQLTDCPAVISSPQHSSGALRHIECIRIGNHEVLVIVLTRDEQTFAHHIYLDGTVQDHQCKEFSSKLNHHLQGLSVEELPEKFEKMIKSQTEPIWRDLLAKLNVKLSLENKGDQIIRHGIKKLASIKKENIHAFLESRLLERIMHNARLSPDVQVYIADEQKGQSRDISLVTGSYFFGDRAGGAIGVIGPNRMNYAQAMGVIEYMRNLLSAVLTKKSN